MIWIKGGWILDPSDNTDELGDILIKDGTNGTKKITVKDAATEFAGLVSAVNHRNIFRGKNLGSTITDAQKAAIANGTFDDLFIVIASDRKRLEDMKAVEAAEPARPVAPERRHQVVTDLSAAIAHACLVHFHRPPSRPLRSYASLPVQADSIPSSRA